MRFLEFVVGLVVATALCLGLAWFFWPRPSLPPLPKEVVVVKEVKVPVPGERQVVERVRFVTKEVQVPVDRVMEVVKEVEKKGGTLVGRVRFDGQKWEGKGENGKPALGWKGVGACELAALAEGKAPVWVPLAESPLDLEFSVAEGKPQEAQVVRVRRLDFTGVVDTARAVSADVAFMRRWGQRAWVGPVVFARSGQGGEGAAVGVGLRVSWER